MSFGLGDAHKRPGIFDSFRAAMTPAPLPEDDGLPITPPRTVNAAAVLSMLAGLVLLATGAIGVFTIDSQLSAATALYNTDIQTCVDRVQGIGSAVVIPPGADESTTKLGQSCQGLRPLTEEMISNFKTVGTIYAIVFTLIGLIAAVGGWFMRSGARWSRLAVAGAAVVLILMSLALQAQTIFTLAATLVLIVSVMLCFVGKGAVYFARLKARRAG